MMEWKKLLTEKRLGKPDAEEANPERSPFQRDYDRIVFSSSFRRLKDKTQVYSLAKNDYIRTRLTHSIEVSCIGRSLGIKAGYELREKYPEIQNEFDFLPFNMGNIVSSACLAHDIGNPPFGHAGEGAIQSSLKQWQEWDNIANKQLNQQQRYDFEKFEGNAQGFRILTALEMVDRYGGMQLTYPTLAAFTKYPRESYIPKEIINGYQGKSIKKHGFFQSEKHFFKEVADAVGLISRDPNSSYAWWCRHPLAFLVEAADDICYRIIDLEDGYRMGFIPFSICKEKIVKIAQKTENEINENASSDEEKIKYLRAVAINQLIESVIEKFIEKEYEILKGEFDKDLLSLTSYESILNEIAKLTKEYIFNAREVISIQLGGYEVLDNLLTKFANASLYQNSSQQGEMIYNLLPKSYHPKEGDDYYNKLLKVTDYISGMTDSYAKDLFQTIKGVSLE